MAGHLSPALFDFLFDLDVNNDRAWFERNRARFEADVREPVLGLVTELAEPLRRLSRHLVADPRRQGGSMFRIHRDTRFSRDKTPYKTWVACQFRHERGRDVHAPGLYLHLEPGNTFAAAGMWRPDGAALGAIRARIDAQPRSWGRVANGAWLRDGAWELTGESLRTAPRGYPRDHPRIVDLRRKDFIARHPLQEREVTAAGFAAAFVDRVGEARPLLSFLCRSLDLPL